ncbi:MAG TPA: O-antigen ligase family protein [Saprospiraceae bacterium]|nr:O-antigen ligase family protein [Saprospiraceae bacterium]
MSKNIPSSFSFIPSELLLFGVFACIVLASVFGAVYTEMYFLAGFPAVLLLGYLAVVDFRKIYYLLLFSIPLSTEVVLPNGFGTDLPTEPLTVGLMLLFLLFWFRHRSAVKADFLKHPVTLLLLLHWGWMVVPMLSSADPFISLKFFLAKSWYIVTFYFLTGYMIRDAEDVRRFFWAVFITLILTVVVVLIRHSTYGFSFEDVYRVLSPFYRNHVSYAAIMAVFIPFVWFVRQWYPAKSLVYIIIAASTVILLIAIQLSYTRAAMGAVLLSVAAYWVIRLKLVKPAILIAAVVVVAGLGWMSSQNTYLDFAPQYEKTISHTRFDNLLEATAQGEDISTMERFYRWIAGFYMVGERPLTGFGPGNFLEQYKAYTVSSFRTYVSHNPEQSGIHCYYLMISVEQGLPGLLFFLLMSFAALVYGEQLYHRVRDRQTRQAVMATMLSFISILILCVINDLIETDKIGSFFFINMAMLVQLDITDRRQNALKNDAA